MVFKKISASAIFYCLLVIGIFPLDAALLNKWIGNWDEAAIEKSGYKISALTDNAGDSIGMELKKEEFAVKITVNNETGFQDFIKTLKAVDRAFNSGKLFIDGRGYGKIKFKSVEIIFGSTDLVMVLPVLEKLILSWDMDREISLDLTEKIRGEIVFRYDLKNHDFIYAIDYYNKIKIATGTGDLFRSWSFYLENLFFALQKGIKNSDKESRDMVNTALINIDLSKLRPKRQKSDFFYLSIENYESCMLLNKNMDHNNYMQFRIDSKILSAFSIRNLGAPDWTYKPFGVGLISGIFADANISNAVRGSKNGIFGILRTGLSIGFGCSAGIPILKKDPETGRLLLVNVISAFTFETIFNINMIDLNYSPFDVDIIFGLDLFPGYLAYMSLFIGVNTDGRETGFTVGGKLVFDINLPQPRMARNRLMAY